MESKPDWRQHLYQQTRIRDVNGRIRLLTVQPRQYATSRPEAPPDAMHCYLKLAQLGDQPKFSVISHTLPATEGSDESKSLIINGAEVPVSSSLFELLSCVQTESEPLSLFVDVLCTNQADNDETERSVHISQLAEIYRAAEKTIIWLGSAADQSDEAMKVLRRLADEGLTLRAFVTNWTPQIGQQLAQKILPSSKSTGLGSSPASSEETKDVPDLEKHVESLRTALKALMNREYWTNIWSLVELSLTHNGLVACGRQGLSLDSFYSAAKALDHIINHATYSRWLASATAPVTPAGSSASATSSEVLRTEEISNFSQSPALRVISWRENYRRDANSWLKSPDHPLFTILSGFYGASPEQQLQYKISDPRDRVYALSCLATDCADLGFVVHYGLGVDQVYAEASAALLRKHPRVLQLAQGTNRAKPDMPSWAIDWENIQKPPSDLGSERPFDACGPADARFYRAGISTPPGPLALKGAIVDEIKDVGDPYPGPDDSDDSTHTQLRAYLSQIKQYWEDSTNSVSSPYLAEQAAVALAKIAVGDVEVSGASNRYTRASSATVEGYRRTYEALFGAEKQDVEIGNRTNGQENELKEAPAAAPSPKITIGSDTASSVSASYVSAIARMAGRRPFRSPRGYVGLGPGDLAPGDTIAIPYGSPVPFAFRSNAGEDNGPYRLVGEMYVFGIMDGEFMKVHRNETVLRIV
ncbi:heterokaryon incompatibility protein-domain-containing protein [Xylariaceae sp. FL0255]|nr:heterokaryon incompatibility protein-domain-containing protein [Xylariaceae sp. FL0255]